MFNQEFPRLPLTLLPSTEGPVNKIDTDEVREALKQMKNGKAIGPDNIPSEFWKCMGEKAVQWLTELFNHIAVTSMPNEWFESTIIPIFKNKGDVQKCENYRPIKLMSHTMKI